MSTLINYRNAVKRMEHVQKLRHRAYAWKRKGDDKKYPMGIPESVRLSRRSKVKKFKPESFHATIIKATTRRATIEPGDMAIAYLTSHGNKTIDIKGERLPFREVECPGSFVEIDGIKLHYDVKFKCSRCEFIFY